MKATIGTEGALRPLGDTGKLNVFDSFERDTKEQIENNFTRALAISLIHLSRAGHLAPWLRSLVASQAGIGEALKQRVASVAEGLEPIGAEIEADLVCWQNHDMFLDTPRILIGVRGSQLGDRNQWTWGTRPTTEDETFPDAWLGVPKHGLIVVEAKKEGNVTLDAAQIGRQAKKLLLPREDDDLPPTDVSLCAEDGAVAAGRWQAAMADRVLDVGWDDVIRALRVVRQGVAEPVCAWIVDQALGWFDEQGLGGVGDLDQLVQRVRWARLAPKPSPKSALKPREQGKTFLRWRERVRKDLQVLADKLHEQPQWSLVRDKGEVAHAGNDRGDAHVRWQIAEGSRARLALWADLTGQGPELGVSIYEEASGCVWRDEEEGWKRQRTRHEVGYRDAWAHVWRSRCEAALPGNTPMDLSVEIAAVGFRGAQTTWHGGSQHDVSIPGLHLPLAEFLKRLLPSADRFRDHWRYPEHREGVRKPAISLRLCSTIPPGLDLRDGLALLAEQVRDLTRLWLAMEKQAK